MFVDDMTMIKERTIIAVDGHSSTGKSTFAKLIASRYGLIYVDTGALYRGVTLFAIKNSIIDSENRIDEKALSEKIDLSDTIAKLEYEVTEKKKQLFLMIP